MLLFSALTKVVVLQNLDAKKAVVAITRAMLPLFMASPALVLLAFCYVFGLNGNVKMVIMFIASRH